MKLIIYALLTTLPLISQAHSGRTNSEGCHNNRKTGDYHCHNAKHKVQARTYTAMPIIESYNRKDWPHWVDVDNDCQDTRAEILIRDSKKDVKFKRNKGCNVSWGEWLDPYTLKVFTKASDIDIDHIVPLAHAHEMGGSNWTREQKRVFANDFENLIAVEDNANQSKGAKPPQEWMPENKAYHCSYVKIWEKIKLKYKLKLSAREDIFILEKKQSCK